MSAELEAEEKQLLSLLAETEDLRRKAMRDCNWKELESAARVMSHFARLLELNEIQRRQEDKL